MVEMLENGQVVEKSDCVDERAPSPMLKVKADLIDRIETLEALQDRFLDHGYGDPTAINQQLTEARASLRTVTMFLAMKKLKD